MRHSLSSGDPVPVHSYRALYGRKPDTEPKLVQIEIRMAIVSQKDARSILQREGLVDDDLYFALRDQVSHLLQLHTCTGAEK